jgi:hypothetical protein
MPGREEMSYPLFQVLMQISMDWILDLVSMDDTHFPELCVARPARRSWLMLTKEGEQGRIV